MIPYALLPSLISYMMITAFTPGPGNILSLNTVTAYGWQKGRKLVFGICGGYFTLHITAAVLCFCLSQLIGGSVIVIKYIGVLYLLWLAAHIIRSVPDFHGAERSPSFWTGYLMQLINVKVLLFSLTLQSSYFQPYLHTLPKMLLAGFLVSLFGSCASLSWAGAGILMEKFYRAHYKLINRVMGLFLLYSAMTLLLH